MLWLHIAREAALEVDAVLSGRAASQAPLAPAGSSRQAVFCTWCGGRLWVKPCCWQRPERTTNL